FFLTTPPSSHIYTLSLHDALPIFAFIRRYQDEIILVIANLSRFVQYAGLDLSAFRGTSPVELFGRAQLPPIGDAPYFLTLGPHAFYWFELGPVGAVYDRPGAHRAPLQLTVQATWTNVFAGKARLSLEDRVMRYVQTQRWFGRKGREVKGATFVERVAVSFNSADALI